MNRLPSISDSVLILVDVQEKFIPAFPHIASAILPRLHFLLALASELNLPVIVSEQYPAGLGRTLPELMQYFKPGWNVIDKTSFSCFGENRFRLLMTELSVRNLFVAGVETHVCVQQTVCEAISRGYDVYPLVDALASRNQFDHDAAISYMCQAGARVTSSESAVFMLMKDAKHPSFRFVQKFIKHKK